MFKSYKEFDTVSHVLPLSIRDTNRPSKAIRDHQMLEMLKHNEQLLSQWKRDGEGEEERGSSGVRVRVNARHVQLFVNFK